MSFDKEAKTWDQNPEKAERARVFAKEILHFIKPNNEMTAMEFGSGTGLLSEQLKDYFHSISLLDTSEGMIEVLKEKIIEKKLSNFYPYQIDLTQDTFDQKDFDVIYMSMTLHHIPDLDNVIKIFHSKIKRDGYLCVADLEKEDGTFHSSSDYDGHLGFDRHALEDLLYQHGFKAIYYAQPYTITKANDDTTKEYPLFLMIAQKMN